MKPADAPNVLPRWPPRRTPDILLDWLSARTVCRRRSVRFWQTTAERWGIGDDYDREVAIQRATTEERKTLIDAIGSAPDELWDWLAGEESLAKEPTPEYVAVTNMTMAYESARLKEQ